MAIFNRLIDWWAPAIFSRWTLAQKVSTYLRFSFRFCELLIEIVLRRLNDFYFRKSCLFCVMNFSAGGGTLNTQTVSLIFFRHIFDELIQTGYVHSANDPRPQIIPRSEMIHKLDRKWPRTANDPRCRPQMITPEDEEWHGIFFYGSRFQFLT